LYNTCASALLRRNRRCDGQEMGWRSEVSEETARGASVAVNDRKCVYIDVFFGEPLLVFVDVVLAVRGFG
jgi:hypothetical protein